jgi:hypothetical protein
MVGWVREKTACVFSLDFHFRDFLHAIAKPVAVYQAILSGGGARAPVNSTMRPAISMGVVSSRYGPRIWIPAR